VNNELWKCVISARYGNDVLGKVRLGGEVYRAGTSVWWRDIGRLDVESGWFAQAVTKKIGNGNSTLFWKDVWLGESSLEGRFPRLFGISTQQEDLIGEMGGWEGEVWEWRLVWRRNFFVWEEALRDELVELLASCNISRVDDMWRWKPGLEGVFSVKSTYIFLDNVLHVQEPLPTLLTFALKFIWKSGVPSKVSAFAWQLLLDRVPTRDNLRGRGVIVVENSLCPLCLQEVETVGHLFLHCRIAGGVWHAIYRWFGVSSVLPPSLPLSYAILVGCGSNRKRRKGFSVIWLAFMWVLWKVRNDRVFNNVVVDVPTIFDLVQRTSWNWYINKTAKAPFLLYEWVWNPGDCMVR
jgi:mannosylglycoprotein endo-beta-mannosidase